MIEKIKIAGVQMEPKILDKERNLSRCVELIESAAKQGVHLIVFPECTLTGYCFSSMKEAIPVCEPIPGPSTEKIIAACHKLNVYVVVGLLEKDRDKYYNAAAFLGPKGLIGKHRKLHLPYMCVDRFVNHGNLPPTVYETELGRIGIGICYDLMFPEYSRVLALQGADVIVLPSNWPELFGEICPDFIIPVRAVENLIFYVGINRVGEERGIKFFGRSKVAHWSGLALAEGKAFEEDILYAEIEPATTRMKYQVVIPGELEVDLNKDRRPEFYSLIAEPLARNPRIRS